MIVQKILGVNLVIEFVLKQLWNVIHFMQMIIQEHALLQLIALLEHLLIMQLMIVFSTVQLQHMGILQQDIAKHNVIVLTLKMMVLTSVLHSV